MSIEEIIQICHKWKGVTQDIKWENHLCLNVGGKMFAITSPDLFPPTASIKVSDEDFETLIQRDGILPAPYLARYKWIHLDDIDLFSKKEWTYYLTQSYQLTFQKLPKKIRAEFESII